MVSWHNDRFTFWQGEEVKMICPSLFMSMFFCFVFFKQRSNPSLVFSPWYVHLASGSKMLNGAMWGPSFCHLTGKLAGHSAVVFLIYMDRDDERRNDRCKKVQWELILSHWANKRLKRKGTAKTTFDYIHAEAQPVFLATVLLEEHGLNHFSSQCKGRGPIQHLVSWVFQLKLQT